MLITSLRLRAPVFLAVVCFCVGKVVAADSDYSPGEIEVRQHLPIDQFEVTTLRLWPDKAPNEPRPIGDETVNDGRRSRTITNVTQPSITIARPKELADPTPVVIVCPGGGYGSLGVTDGGVDIIHWLRPLGVTGVYMKYRVPKRHQGYAQHHHALQDIQRATSMLRSRASELGIDPKRIGAIGFSAGGNLVAMLSTNHSTERRAYDPIDEVDQVSCRPDFVAMVAPAYLTMPILSAELDPALHLDEISIRATPPTFITSAISDKFTVGSLHYFLALREKHVTAELHIYEKGGHAEGIRTGPDNQWPTMFADWLKREGLLSSPGK
ncbi:MAG TPA: alpha/beta hydrolase [Pirellulales bacterium]|nr:alpha/beta hydrolase [Pirellulales bacterium]